MPQRNGYKIINSMRQYIARSVGYPLQDIYRKTNILETLKLLRESQYWDEEKLRDYQSAKLQMLIEHAYRNVPYYTDLFDSIKLRATDIQTVDDIYKIPILTKDIIRKEKSRLVAAGYNMQHVKQGKTGGTTGVPITVYKDTANRSYTWASYYRWYEWMGLDYSDKVATLWGARTVTNKSTKDALLDKATQYIQNEFRIDSFELTETSMMKSYKKLDSYEPLLLKGYLSALLDFASFLKKNNLHNLAPIALSSTTETLMMQHRVYLEDIFNAPIYDQYGCGELSAISYECKAHNGLHVNMEHILCEILNEADLSVFDTTGRVVGTDLDNYVMPFIRYENGDISSISTKKCTCGINQPLMNSIDGRTIDTIELKSGKKVHGVFFTDIMYELGIPAKKIQKFQIYQNQPGDIEFRIQCEEPLGKAQQLLLMKAVQVFFNNVSYSEHKLLPVEQNGKYKYIINAIKN